MGKNAFVKIIINNKSNKTDVEYTYGVYESMLDKINIGSRVIIPFGKGNKPIEGFVVDKVDRAGFELSKVKYVKEVVDEKTILSQEFIDLCRWMKEEYLCQFIDAIQCVMPTGASLKRQREICLKENMDKNLLRDQFFSPKQKDLIRLLMKHKSIGDDLLNKHFDGKDMNATIKELEAKNIIVVRNHFKSEVKTLYEKMIHLSSSVDMAYEMSKLNKQAKKQREVLECLLAHGPVAWSQLKERINISYATIRSLLDKGFIHVTHVKKRRDPYENMKKVPRDGLILTNEQKGVIYQIRPFIESEIYKTFLLHGVTGSGKTEVYMQLIDTVISKSKEAIVLVPEIALTSQMIERFKGRFGDTVAVLHSKLSLGERYDEWHRIKRGKVKIVIGARSAIFAPFENLGIIIIDEEHENTYKSDSNPKYHAAEIAAFRCKRKNAVLILGSATPSIETYEKAKNNEYQKVEMLHRFNDNPLPHIEIVDMREELHMGNKSVFSRSLYEEMKNNLEKREQTILFLNRRGYSTFISCRNCGYVVKCPNCEISLTYHQNSHHISCHYCGFTKAPPTLCPKCSSKYIKYFGVGTERIESLTKKAFPNARVARLDSDTTSKKGVMDQTISAFRRGEIDILIGTQMIAKGLDFPNVTLVGVIAADTNLNLPDFRSAEKTFQLITQVAGRAGRGNTFGRVVVQTYEPEHFAIQCSQKHDYGSFYEQEIILRREFFYPPYARLINILFTGTNESQVIGTANDYVNELTCKLMEYKINPNEVIYGPNPASLSKIKEKFRWQVVIKSKPVDQNLIKGIINGIRLEGKGRNYSKNIGISIDINPYSML